MQPRLLFLLVLLALGGLLVSIAPRSVPAQPPSASDDMKRITGFLGKYCLDCHDAKKKRGDLALHGYTDEVSLLKGRKVWQMVLQMAQSGEMPPKEKLRPPAQDVESFAKAVNAVFERADRTSKPDPGRVTIRRLNRVEYNNTIRDLVGIDFNPAEDFPSDDVGHGFDNIGDVLTLSPVLLERYLAAAESIMQRAIAANPPAPPIRALASRWLEPAQQADIRWRPMQGKNTILHTPYKLSLDGEYTFRIRAYGQSADAEKPKVAFLADGKEIARHEIVATTEKMPAVYETKLPLPIGDVRMTVSLLNAGEGATARTVFVEWFELRGPSDTRPLTQRKLLACAADKPKPEQTHEVLTRFTSQAYRRPTTPAELDRLVKLVEESEKRGERWEAGMQLAMQAVLVSPKFLFRVELDDRPDAADAHPIDEYQLASRLSYFLWSSMPDRELFDLAGKKQLTANLDAQVARMLADPKAKAFVDNFALQWLQLRRLAAFAPDPKLFPGFNDKLRAAMLEETKLFFEAVLREDRSVLDLIDADFTFLNEPLAHHYGITDTNGTRAGQKPKKPGGQPIRGDKFVRVNLSDGERGGLLTQASVLTVTSNPTRTSPVKRGKWVLEQLLGSPPPPPPPDVPELEAQKGVLTGSLRQQMEQHRKNPTCANCHAKMDPLGFAFENFDAVGRFRAKDGDFAIDASGTLPDGKSFQGPAELKTILKGKKDLFSRCLAEKLFIYALGRGVEYHDRGALDRIGAALAKNDYRFSTLITEIARSDPFRLRRGKEQAK